METGKMELNDQIVLLRRCVKVAKVHTVRRLFRQMKMWRQKKGKTEKDIKKNQRKAERIKEEISIITKADPDVISKMALKEQKDWKSVILQKDITTEERSFAHLINHKKIQEKVTQFRDAHPDWQSWLSSTLQRWERKKQAKIERMNSAPLKDKSINSESRLEGSTGETDNENDVDEKESTGQKHFIKANSSPDNKVNKKKDGSKKKKGKPNKQNQKDAKVKTEYKDVLSEFLTKPKSEIAEKVEGSMEISEIDLDKLEDQETLPIHSICHVETNATTTEDVPKPEKKLKDALFLGMEGDDESDQESQSESEQSASSENEQTANNKPKSQFVTSLSGSKGNDFSQLRNRIHPKFFPKQDQNPRKGIFQRQKRGLKKQFDEVPHRNMKKFSQGAGLKKMGGTTDSIEDSKLHPSWEAKRKMKQTAILPFQGKKIRFDVND